MPSSTKSNSRTSNNRHSLHLHNLRGGTARRVLLTDSPAIRLGRPDHFGLDFVDGRRSLIVDDFSHELSFPHSTNLIVESTHSAEESALIASGFSRQAAAEAVPWLLATSTTPFHLNETPLGTQFFTVRYLLPRAIVRSTPPDYPSPTREFVDTLFLGSLDTDKLKAAFDHFGHVVPQEIWLGGSVVATIKVRPGEMDQIPEDVRELCIRIAFEARLGICSVSDYGLSDEERLVVRKVQRKLNVMVLGGMAGPMGSQSSLDRWIETLEDPSKWEAIRVNHVFPIADLLRRSHPTIFNQVASTLGSIPMEEEEEGEEEEVEEEEEEGDEEYDRSSASHVLVSPNQSGQELLSPRYRSDDSSTSNSERG